jgi:hypothetical protein
VAKGHGLKTAEVSMNHQFPSPVRMVQSSGKQNAFKLQAPKNETSIMRHMLLLREISQLGQLIQQFLQVPIRDLVLKTGDERLGFLGIIATQTTYSEDSSQ